MANQCLVNDVKIFVVEAVSDFHVEINSTLMLFQPKSLSEVRSYLSPKPKSRVVPPERARSKPYSFNCTSKENMRLRLTHTVPDNTRF